MRRRYKTRCKKTEPPASYGEIRLGSWKKADVLITVKESIANGHKIYSIELDEINKASERFRGLSDAAENSGQGN